MYGFFLRTTNVGDIYSPHTHVVCIYAYLILYARFGRMVLICRTTEPIQIIISQKRSFIISVWWSRNYDYKDPVSYSLTTTRASKIYCMIINRRFLFEWPYYKSFLVFSRNTSTYTGLRACFLVYVLSPVSSSSVRVQISPCTFTWYMLVSWGQSLAWLWVSFWLESSFNLKVSDLNVFYLITIGRIANVIF